jgi:uncharacterized membrane protein (DUF106 family)
MADKAPPSAAGASSQLIMIMVLFLTMFIMFDPTLRSAIGGIAGYVLYPVIGFGGHYPVLTVFVAGVLMVTFSTAVRHYFIDWVSAAEKQKKMKDFNKKFREARMSGNADEVQRMTKKQMEIMKEGMQSSMDQMKPMVFTMIFLIGTFAFIGTFIYNLENATLSVPWAPNVDMNMSLNLGICCPMTNWMLLYFLISLALAQIISRALKWYSFDKKLKKMALEEGKEPKEEEEVQWKE